MKYSGTVFLLFILLLTLKLDAQNPDRPPIWGIARITYAVSDFEAARNYYGRFLGFRECFGYQAEAGKVISFKVNDRQFLEFAEINNSVGKPGMLSVSFETDDAARMRQYLASNGFNVPSSVSDDGAGNLVFSVSDTYGNRIEFIEYGDNSLHSNSKGKYLSENRISDRIHHAGLYAGKIQSNDLFYKQLLGFREIWRYPDNQADEPSLLYLAAPDCIENVELLSTGDPSSNHPCLLVDDMQEAIDKLRDRRINEILNKPSVGRGNRWLLNITDKDNIKVEFTEAHTIR